MRVMCVCVKVTCVVGRCVCEGDVCRRVVCVVICVDIYPGSPRLLVRLVCDVMCR